MKNFKILLLMIISIFASCQQETLKLKPTKSVATEIPEPSDICYNPKTDTFFIVSDKGILIECNKISISLRLLERNRRFERVERHCTRCIDYEY